jgi:hypothetical protein
MKALHGTAFGLALFAAALCGNAASAAQISSGSQLPLVSSQAASPIQKIQFGHCARWHRICRARWGFGWRFRRCMRIHGC